MNDTKEIWHLIETIEKLFLMNVVSKKRKLKTYSSIKNKIRSFSDIFFFTYIAENDAAQWERYGGHGAGVCLEFDAKN